MGDARVRGALPVLTSAITSANYPLYVVGCGRCEGAGSTASAHWSPLGTGAGDTEAGRGYTVDRDTAPL